MATIEKKNFFQLNRAIGLRSEVLLIDENSLSEVKGKVSSFFCMSSLWKTMICFMNMDLIQPIFILLIITCLQPGASITQSWIFVNLKNKNIIRLGYLLTKIGQRKLPFIKSRGSY